MSKRGTKIQLALELFEAIIEWKHQSARTQRYRRQRSASVPVKKWTNVLGFLTPQTNPHIELLSGFGVLIQTPSTQSIPK
jgi:hypothetical protein